MADSNSATPMAAAAVRGETAAVAALLEARAQPQAGASFGFGFIATYSALDSAKDGPTRTRAALQHAIDAAA